MRGFNLSLMNLQEEVESVIYRQIDAVEMLVRDGIDVLHQNNDGKTALQILSKIPLESGYNYKDIFVMLVIASCNAIDTMDD